MTKTSLQTIIILCAVLPALLTAPAELRAQFGELTLLTGKAVACLPG